jgi:hypothetical protein
MDTTPNEACAHCGTKLWHAHLQFRIDGTIECDFCKSVYSDFTGFRSPGRTEARPQWFQVGENGQSKVMDKSKATD